MSGVIEGMVVGLWKEGIASRDLDYCSYLFW